MKLSSCSDDIIRIDGVEYELERPVIHASDGDMLYVRPKRKQTGWVCRKESCSGKCYKATMARPSFCVITGWGDKADGCDCGSNWQPFYGKVVE